MSHPPMTEENTTTTSDHPPPSQTTILIPNLPNDVAIQCIARVPRHHHPTLSLVSKSFHSIIRSKHFFITRSNLNSTQHSLYLNIRHKSSFKWYHFHPNHNNNLKLPKPIMIHPVPCIPTNKQPVGPAVVVLGPKIYLIGGSINDVPCNSVWVFDCRVNKWETGPKMRVGREFAAGAVVNGKVFVLGGCLVDNRTRAVNWAEVLDPGVGVWGSVESGSVDGKDKWMHASAVINGKVYAMADRGGVVYDVEKNEWGKVPKRLDLGWRGRGAVIDSVLYCYDYLGKIRGYDVAKDVWKDLRGVDKGLPNFLCGATMVDLDGWLCVLWESKLSGGKTMDVMCALIEVRKDEDGGLSGNILWVDGILSVPAGSSILHCMAIAL
uniref:F-box/kelch-repeat protein SKIP6 n=1 Tax=Erigeron canadensis TaxID=72917 RepID=UPI001CB8CCF2|nr:F-box/kelch-repeat protein SKIP6 [Erigeron canadensis]